MTILYCERCEQPIDPNRVIWLEMNRETCTYSTVGVPPELSDGWFAFGAACARKALTEGAGLRVKARRTRY